MAHIQAQTRDERNRLPALALKEVEMMLYIDRKSDTMTNSELACVEAGVLLHLLFCFFPSVSRFRALPD